MIGLKAAVCVVGVTEVEGVEAVLAGDGVVDGVGGVGGGT